MAQPALLRAEVDNYQDIGNTTVGPAYWALAKESFPDAEYVVQVPLATTDVNETVAWTEAAVNSVGWDRIQAIELGNEPNFYHAGFGFDIGSYSGVEVGKEAYILDVETCFKLGIDRANRLKTVAHHYYQNDAGGADKLAQGLMDVAATHAHLDLFKARRIDWLRQNQPDIPFVLSEVGNSLDATHSYPYQARLGSALWQVDFCLYAMSLGVAHVHYQQIMHAGYNLWLPVASAGMSAQVFANFYSQPFVADFMGKQSPADNKKKTTMQKLDIGKSDDTRPNLAAYAAFEDGVLKRIAVANLEYWSKTSSTHARARPTVERRGLPAGTKEIRVDVLGSPEGAGAGAESITYAGCQWTFASGGRRSRMCGGTAAPCRSRTGPRAWLYGIARRCCCRFVLERLAESGRGDG
ncbi:hypothetical protein PG994_013699 [Apiospora phragmitis]|uniref:Beta-glucuronidase C-terminal domain-containing protein n=1 Tax=Apiospora phragmitis TaxID=2905665 RepID=A0ABR1T9D8_9PEZI